MKDLLHITDHYREAADKIWELAEEYGESGLFELAGLLKEVSGQIHEKARQKELGELDEFSGE